MEVSRYYKKAIAHYNDMDQNMCYFIEDIQHYCDENLAERINDWAFDGDNEVVLLVDIDDYNYKYLQPSDLFFFIKDKAPDRVTYDDIKEYLYE